LLPFLAIVTSFGEVTSISKLIKSPTVGEDGNVTVTADVVVLTKYPRLAKRFEFAVIS
jgi:hypothetical protein